VLAVADWGLGYKRPELCYSHIQQKPWVRTSPEVPDNVYSSKANCVAVKECGTCEKCKGSSFHASIKAKVSNTDWKHCVGEWKEA